MAVCTYHIRRLSSLCYGSQPKHKYIYALLMLSNSLKMIKLYRNMSEFCQIVYKNIIDWFYCMNCLLVYRHE